jgi:D-3-phosphoglycerate dehydrogenase
MTYTIVVAAPLSEDGLAILQAAEDVALHVVPETPEAILPHLPSLNVLIVGDDLVIDSRMIEAAPNLQIIGRAGSSLNQIDVDEATRRGIIVMNAPGVDAVTVAEYTFTVMLALVRGIFPAHHDLLEGIWNHQTYQGRELKGKTLGIIGYGRVGREVASRALAFGLEVLVTDPFVPESEVAGLRLKLVGMDELLRQSDIITLHTSAVPETQGFINAQTLAKMKRGVYLINIKHHSLVNPADLKTALDSTQVAGAALDDFDPQTLAGHPLIGYPHVIHTQRMRYNTVEARRDLSTVLAHQILDALRQEDYRNAVNLPFMPGREYEAIEPLLKMAEKIGMIHHHLARRSAIRRIELHIQGDEMQGLIKPLTVALLKGLLAPMYGTRVNYINAPVLAHERGIMVTQTKRLQSDTYPNLLTTQVFWDDGFELVVAGAMFNRTEPHIVTVDQYRTDFVPEGNLLIMGSYDVPGVIGRAGTFMADHGINIAGWRTSRVVKGGNTLSIISIDEPLSEELLAELRSKDFARHVTQIIFA